MRVLRFVFLMAVALWALLSLYVSVVVADLAAAGGLAAIPPRAEALCAPWLPGAVTLLFRPGPKAPPSIVSAQNTGALRGPQDPVAPVPAAASRPRTPP